jgi:hypothetical protein
MSTEKTSDLVRALAEQHGLKRALELFPDAVKAGAERGLRPVGDPPRGHVPTAHPAPVFDPTRYESRK